MSEDRSGGTTAPATRGFAITPGDDADLAVDTRAIWVGVSGDVKVTTVGGDTFVLPAVAAGIPIPVRVRRVWSTSTTASSIVGLY